MSFADWVKNGWLVAHKSSKQEIANLLGIVSRDLKDSQAKDVSDDWRFAIADMPVLFIGGDKSLGKALGAQMKLVAGNITVVIVKNSGHWVVEEPKQINLLRHDEVRKEDD